MMNFRHYRIGTRLLMTTVGSLCLMVVFAMIGLFSLNSVSDKVHEIVNRNTRLTEHVVEMQFRNLLISRDVRTALVQEEIAKQAEEERKVEANIQLYLDAEKQILANLKSPRDRESFTNILPARKAAEASIHRLLILIKAGNQPDIESYFFNDFSPKMQSWNDAIGNFLQLQKAANAADVAGISDIKSGVQITLLLLVGLAVIIMISTGLWVTRQITRPLGEAVAVADAVAAGKLDNEIDTSATDEAGQLMLALSRMQSDLKVRTDQDRKTANEALRVKVALDATSNSVMVADPDGVIIYCNAAVIDMMRKAEADLRKIFPDFQAGAILGSNFDIFHSNPSHQRNLLATLKGVHRAEISVGGRVFLLVASPIVNDRRERLGTVVEWRDRTAEVAIEEEISSIIAAAGGGDFSRRIVADQMSGFVQHVSKGINDLLDVNSRALQDLGVMLSRLSQGDLTHKITTPYQGTLGLLKEDANSTVDTLQEIVFSIKSATDMINAAAQEIASGNHDLSRRTEQQASNLEETASSMEELTSTVKQNAENAHQATALASNAQLVAEKGGQVVDEVVKTMGAIYDSSKRISDIIGVIDTIAFQTNILALNAAVEAARAGEQGRGFAVVATEVRSLAQRSAAAAKEIKGLISDSVDKVQTGSRLVDQAGQTMDEVVASIQRVARIMADISDASREQTIGIEQVGLAISEMDKMTQQNAALVEEAAAAAESLEGQARCLAESVSVFRLQGSVVVSNQSPLSGLDFDGAIAAHGKWRQRLLDYLDGNGEFLDPAIVMRDDQCALGCWIHGDGRALHGSSQYADLKKEHVGFHRCAADVIRLQMAGNSTKASEQVFGEFTDRSRRVIALLETMRKSRKTASAPMLTAVMPNRPSARIPVLSALDGNEWSEF